MHRTLPRIEVGVYRQDDVPPDIGPVRSLEELRRRIAAGLPAVMPTVMPASPVRSYAELRQQVAGGFRHDAAPASPPPIRSFADLQRQIAAGALLQLFGAATAR